MTDKIFDVDSELFALKYKIYKYHRRAQKYQHKYFLAARTIQTIYRGYAVRKYMKYLNAMATIIQKYFRRYEAQIVYFQLLQDTLQEHLVKYYNLQALIIQKTYRGFQSRKNIFDYYRMKKWIKLVEAKNEELKLDSIEHLRREHYQKLMEDCRGAEKLLEEVGIKVHHMLRTYHRPGVYSKHFSHAYSIIEKFLAAMKFRAKERKHRLQLEKEKKEYIDEVNEKYHRVKSLKTPLKRCDPHWRYRKVDLTDYEPDIELKERNFVFGPIKHTHPKSIFAETRYTELKWSDLERVYGSDKKKSGGGDDVKEVKDFNLSTRLVDDKYEFVEEFLIILTNFCRIHNIVMK